MTAASVMLLAVYMAALAASAPTMGRLLARLAERRPMPAALGAFERAILRRAAVDPEREMTWREYAAAVLVFSAVGVAFVYALQRLQAGLPFNPQGFAAVSPDSAFNTAVSFVTNTNWQGYGGESTMSYLTQMLGLAVQNFVSAATGIAVAFALMRGFASATTKTLGNFWVDLVRITGWLLLPLSFVFALALASQGVPQTIAPYAEATLIEPLTFDAPRTDAAGKPMTDAAGKPLTESRTATTQVIALGPIASQEAIKLLGTNGGGFLNANSAHPFENPTAFTNFLQMLAILLIPSGLAIAFGRMVGDVRQGWAIWSAMAILFVAAAIATTSFEQQGNAAAAGLGVDMAASIDQPGGNMEGKESRFGIGASALFATITTAASCGAVTGMHDSFTPAGGLVPMWLMQLGEVVFGGVGSGLYGMLVFAIIAVFVAGLMVGRTPEYLGKKIESFEMKMASIVVLVTPLLVLVGTALALSLAPGREGISNPGAHGLSQVLYAFSSAANNNGSAFAGLSANTPFYNATLGLAMWFGRFAIIVPVLAIAGSLAGKKRLAASSGSMPTHGPLFVALLMGVVLLVGALSYIPALALGPIAEQLVVSEGARP